MPYVSLAFPPGVVRPGTRYDARGRWYDSNLVRWHERAMQPIGGWQAMLRSTDLAVSNALSDDGGVGTDETADCNDAGANDIVLIPATPAVDDAFYVGHTFRFTELVVNVGTAGTGGTVVWEYYNGVSFVALSGVVDNTVGFTVAGTNTVSFTLPADWTKYAVNWPTPYYHIRARVSVAGSAGATGTQVWIGGGPLSVDEPVRGLLAYRNNAGTPHLFIGTPTKAYAFVTGALTDITPASGFTTGNADAAFSSGAYGTGPYGGGSYGVGDLALSTLTEANTWQIDTFGEDLVACAYSDGKLYQFDTSAGGDLAAITNAPTGCKGVVVTPERFVVALGASSDGRLVQWADQETLTTWAATATNQAGDFTLPGTGQIMCGLRSKSETLIWTDVDLFAMRYIGAPFVYSFQQVGNACGIISRRAAAVFDGKAMWMGTRGFFVYDGFVRRFDCAVGDYVFNDMNRVQASKIFAVRLSEVGETTWFYPSGGSTEIDRYVTVTDEGHWQIGQLQRTSFVGRDAFGYPIGADASGAVYQHETGTSYLDHNGNTLTPYAESGPIELGAGDNIMHVQEFIPDERTLGDAQVYVYSSMYPTAAETQHGPFTLANPTSTRLTGRQVRVRVQQVRSGWRFGTPRLGIVLGGQR